jgi:ribonucleoside-diphosphate reductase alpha chain
MGGRYVPSLLAAIGEVIERHMIEIGFLSGRTAPRAPSLFAAMMPRDGVPANFCPRCGEASFVKLEGCDSCLSCGYSKCG